MHRYALPTALAAAALFAHPTLAKAHGVATQKVIDAIVAARKADLEAIIAKLPDQVTQAATAFRWPVTPWCPDSF